MTVFLLKNRSDDADLARNDPYEQELEEVQFVPVMDYHNINTDELCESLTELNKYDGIIVTSQRAVDAMKTIINSVPRGVLQKPIFTVGPTTAERLRILNFEEIVGSESGNGLALAERLLETIPQKSRFLFLAGEIHRKQLPDKLTEAGHSVTTKIVYRTSPNNEVTHYIQNNVRDLDWIVFFSPSHTEKVVEYLKSTNKPVNVAAIGPTTKHYLSTAGLPVRATASEPTARGLRKAIEEALEMEL